MSPHETEYMFIAEDGTKIAYRGWWPTGVARQELILLHRGHEHAGVKEHAYERLAGRGSIGTAPETGARIRQGTRAAGTLQTCVLRAWRRPRAGLCHGLLGRAASESSSLRHADGAEGAPREGRPPPDVVRVACPLQVRLAEKQANRPFLRIRG